MSRQGEVSDLVEKNRPSAGRLELLELLAQMRLEKGDEFYVTDTPDGLRITTHNPEFQEQMRVGREIMKERRAVLRELAR